MTNRVTTTLVTIVAIAFLVSCVRAKRPVLQPTAVPQAGTLWTEPTDLERRDLFNGPWGTRYAPDPQAVYTLVERKHDGVNPGVTVRDPEGREWSVKQSHPGGLDVEGQVEVTLSRLLSAVGYHQPPVYYLPAFTMKTELGESIEIGGRFRPKLEILDDAGPWQWEDTPFVGTKPYQGLLVLLMMFNSTDLKNSNNSIYEHRTGDLVERRYVVRDLGAALGDTHRLAPRKNHPDSFDRHGFIAGVKGGFVDFAYQGWYQKFVRDRITPDEVAWASNLLGRLSDRQWRDAFRAGGYDAETAERFIRKLQEKIAQGRAVGRQAAATANR